MQVKKFEAKTMKEALELVKVNMGPEAIILSAKDSHRGFGLMGERSVEVTAAVSDETLRKKKIAESKLREDLRERFQQIPAAKQKQFINKVFRDAHPEARELAMVSAQGGSTRAQTKIDRPAPPRAPSVQRYIDIPDEVTARELSQERVRRAAERARMASRDILQDPPQPKATSKQNAKPPVAQAAIPAPSADVQGLEAQVRELRSIIDRFQKMPQVPLSLHPGAEHGLSFEMSAVFQRLTGQGLNPAMMVQLLKRAQKELDQETLQRAPMIEAWVVRQLLGSVKATPDPLHGRYHVFMGSTGQGKTSSLIKFAAHLLLHEKRTVAVISLDTIKVGAADQLRIYAQILNVPFAIVRSPEEWQVAEQKLANVQHILVDVPGFTLGSMDEADWLKRMLPPPELNRTIHYVQSVLARDEDAMDLAGRFQMIGFHDVIFTRLDESSRQGLILNFQERFHVPLHSFGLGPRVPEDFEFATKERVIEMLFKLTKIGKKEAQP